MDKATNLLISKRSNILYFVVFVAGAIIIARLFYLQVIKHDYYAEAALAEHESKFTIPSNRGQIYAQDGSQKSPLVLNEVLPTVYIDPQGIDNEENDSIANSLSEILNIDKDEVVKKLEMDESRYQIIKKQVSRSDIKKIEEAELSGVGYNDETYRVYPQGNVGSQLLGFVNHESEGQYGIEQYLNDTLKGKDGRLNAVTDVYGIPLSSNEENIQERPIDGKDVTLTIDINIQKYVEEALEKGVKAAEAQTGSAIVIDPKTGAVRAMANYPTYNPGEYSKVKDFNVFSNKVVESPYETGSGVKVFTMSTALNENAVEPTTEYFDAGYVQVDDRRIENAGTSGGVTRTMQQVIQNSVNTGVVYALQQLGGGEINQEGKEKIYDYFTKKFGLGAATGIEQANEASGLIYSPSDPQGNNVRYANMTFGQGMTVTMLQMVAGVSSLVNGGDYYQPYLVSSTTDQDNQEVRNEPRILRKQVITKETSDQIKSMMESVVDAGGGYLAKRPGYSIGGKTGTAQVIDEETGIYSDSREIGSFIGFGGGEEVEYVIMTRVDEPKIPGYAGTVAASPIFADISNWLIDYYQIPPM